MECTVKTEEKVANNFCDLVSRTAIWMIEGWKQWRR